ncbi:MAG: hypothetical protein IJW19_00475 [Clostridia bacterium]|nr:hypothetical protein [Clostridia bacterium]
MKKRLLLLLMYICSFVCSVTPLVIYFLANWDKYVKSYEDGVKLSLGGIICVALVLLKISGRMHMPSSTVTLGIILILSYLLRSITDDLIVFSFIALISDITDKIFFSIPIKRIKEGIIIDRGADATAKRVEEIVARYYRGGV